MPAFEDPVDVAFGAAVLYFLQVVTVQYTEYWPTVLGLILLVILMFLPDGLVGLAQRLGLGGRKA